MADKATRKAVRAAVKQDSTKKRAEKKGLKGAYLTYGTAHKTRSKAVTAGQEGKKKKDSRLQKKSTRQAKRGERKMKRSGLSKEEIGEAAKKKGKKRSKK